MSVRPGARSSRAGARVCVRARAPLGFLFLSAEGAAVGEGLPSSFPLRVGRAGWGPRGGDSLLGVEPAGCGHTESRCGVRR